MFSIKITSYVSFGTPFIYLSLDNLTRISEERCFEAWNVGELQRKYASYSRMDCVLGKVCRLGVRNSVCSQEILLFSSLFVSRDNNFKDTFEIAIMIC